MKPDNKYAKSFNRSSSKDLKLGRNDRGEPLYHGVANSYHGGYDPEKDDGVIDTPDLKNPIDFGKKNGRVDRLPTTHNPKSNR